MSETFDVIVIGSGPGGYYAAIRCAQKGATVAIVEKAEIGGTCLNRGCIPSKSLLASAETMLRAKNASAMGVDVQGVSVNWAKMQQRKEAIVAGFRKGLTGLLQANKIKIFQGTGTCNSAKTVVVESAGGLTEINAAGSTMLTVDKGVILATGSTPVEIPAFPFDGQTVISSNEALNLNAIPASMVIVGGGIIGCELACVYAAIGTKVTIVEALEHIINTEDTWVSQLLERELKKLGIGVLTNQKVVSVDTGGSIAKVILQSHSTGSTPSINSVQASSPQASSPDNDLRGQAGQAGQAIEGEKVLVAVGRRATCDKKTVEALKLQTERSVVKVDDKMRTNVPGVYAIGDAVGTTYLAHGAFAEAEVVAENILGGNAKIGDYSLIPRAVYTFPEIASVGKNERDCAEAGIGISVGRAFFRANGRSLAHNETVGEIRVIRDKTSDKILGVTMVGANVTEFAAGARLLIGSTEKFHHVSFPHPSVSEVLKEAWEDAFDASVHLPPKIK